MAGAPPLPGWDDDEAGFPQAASIKERIPSRASRADEVAAIVCVFIAWLRKTRVSRQAGRETSSTRTTTRPSGKALPDLMALAHS
jgi:hypothetical protein